MATLALARRAVYDRKEDVARCLEELKAAQNSAADKNATTSKVLTVTVKEVYGDISVDRVAVRSPCEQQQEKVVVEGIPCSFTLGPGVSDFDLVLMAEHPPASRDAVAGIADLAASTAGVPNGESAAVEQGGAEAAIGTRTREDVIADVVTQEGPEGDEVVVGTTAAEPVALAEPVTATVDTVGTADVSAAAAEADAATTETPALSEEVTAKPMASAGASVRVDTEETAGEDDVSPPTAADAGAEADASQATDSGEDGVAAAVVEVAADRVAEEAAMAREGGQAPAPPPATVVGQDDAQRASASGPAEGGTGTSEKLASAAAGCSTVTTEVVVPSSELDYESVSGQWRYLEAGATPRDGEDTSPVEVSTGVRFAATLEGKDGESAENRIIDLSIKYDEAQLRLRAAEAALERHQPKSAQSTTSDRRQSGAGGSSRKSAMKKGARRKTDGARSAPGGAQKGQGGGGGILAGVSAKVGNLYARCKPLGEYGWSHRNLVIFVTAVYAMHYNGDYLAV